MLINDLDLLIGAYPTHGAAALFRRGINVGHMVDRTRLGLTVHDGDLAHVELVDDLVHQFQWARCASHDAGSQRRQIIGCDIGEVGFGNKHGRHTVQRRALFFRNRAQHNIRVEAFIRKDRARGMGQACQIPHDHAKAVV